MGCTASTPVMDTTDTDYYEKQQNNEVEKMLLQHHQQDKNRVKMLLLGAGESGKSTVLKQMRVLHKGGFTLQERVQYGHIIWADTVSSMQKLIIKGRELGVRLDCDDASNRELFAEKQKVLDYKALDDIDPLAAGGANFLRDYVLKYTQDDRARHKIMNSGNEPNGANGGWENPDGSRYEGNESEDEMMRGLLEDVAPTGEQSKKYTKTEIAAAIQKLWKDDSGVYACFSKSNHFHLEGSAPYFFEKAHLFAQDDYVCTDEDILKGRIKTVGITETNFNIDNTKFKILDAGGQRSERKKWIHCFDDITCVVFVAAVSEYDETLMEDDRFNRMHESIMLFDSLCNYKKFLNKPFILFLNKVDLMKDKVRRSPVRKYFPDYNGKTNDVEDALKYFENLFLSINRSNRPIYVHRTCATDTQSMKFVLTAVTDMVIQESLKKSGLF
ncbi:unnamed protein product [Ambrosiozyma monospora]|uniref:Unnamed protein product n=1 Tax=Ambrosiozyma monospora TaxID=43982 RepID=A0ACB5SYJ8_AMBMO|nr:unnamed protein product [Ambrosiozyma monospora]